MDELINISLDIGPITKAFKSLIFEEQRVEFSKEELNQLTTKFNEITELIKEYPPAQEKILAQLGLEAYGLLVQRLTIMSATSGMRDPQGNKPAVH